MLFSYCIPVDDGAAPNPFWGTCTLAICKPAIRRTATKNDWIVATGSVEYGFQNLVVYAMKINRSMSIQEYDEYCKKNIPEKIPEWKSSDVRKKLGDCIYDFSTGCPILRDSVHSGKDIVDRDLRGKNVLLSNHFYYFGSNPIFLKKSLLPIVIQGQGHRSISNNPFEKEFISWIEGFVEFKNKVAALPFGFNVWNDPDCKSKCTKRHIQEDDEDEKIRDC
jgi:hypothetical protein